MSMKKMKKATMAAMVFLGCVCAPVAATVSYAQLTDAAGNAVESDTSKQTNKSGGGFYDIVFGSGIVGILSSVMLLRSNAILFSMSRVHVDGLITIHCATFSV